jgi:hypothetical protein
VYAVRLTGRNNIHRVGQLSSGHLSRYDDGDRESYQSRARVRHINAQL